MPVSVPREKQFSHNVNQLADRLQYFPVLPLIPTSQCAETYFDFKTKWCFLQLNSGTKPTLQSFGHPARKWWHTLPRTCPNVAFDIPKRVAFRDEHCRSCYWTQRGGRQWRSAAHDTTTIPWYKKKKLSTHSQNSACHIQPRKLSGNPCADEDECRRKTVTDKKKSRNVARGHNVRRKKAREFAFSLNKQQTFTVIYTV